MSGKWHFLHSLTMELDHFTFKYITPVKYSTELTRVIISYIALIKVWDKLERVRQIIIYVSTGSKTTTSIGVI